MMTYSKIHVAGRGIGIAVSAQDGMFEVFGKGWSDIMTSTQFHTFPNSQREANQSHIQLIINHLNRLA